MKRDQPCQRPVAELGSASRKTKGGPTGFIEVSGLLPKEGIGQE